MAKQQVNVWTGGQPWGVAESQRLAEALPVFPAPAPLRRAARIVYQWGETTFEILATACSVRTAPWGGEPMAWLHCKAMQTAKIRPEATTGLMNVLFPVDYVTAIEPGPTFRLARARPPEDIGVFPPNQLCPEDAVPLAEVERVLADLLAAERN